MSSLRFRVAAGIFFFCFALAASVQADTVTGKVVGPDGKPVSGAKIFVSVFSQTPAIPNQETKNLTSDTAGAFSLNLPPPPPVPDQKEKNPTVARVVVAAPGFGLAQAFLTLLPSNANTVRLEKGVPLRGKVVDTAGRPVSGADVRLASLYLGGPRNTGASYLWISDEVHTLPGLTAKTDVNGAWTLADLPATAVHASVALTDAKYVQVSLDIPLGGALAKPLVARLGAALLGKVVGKDGRPRAGALVSARQESYGPGSANAVTDGDGSYRLSGLPTGKVTVWIESARSAIGSTLPIPEEAAAPLRQVSVTEGKETTAPDLILTPGGVVRGIVTDAIDGKPITGATVIAPDYLGVSGADSGGTSGLDGMFSLRLPPGKYRLLVPWGPEGYLASTENGGQDGTEVSLIEGATVSVAFRLARTLTLSGVARDAGGRPVPGVDITVMEQGNPPKTTTDTEGKWTLKNMKPGQQRLVASNDYEIVSGNEIMLDPKAAPAPAPIALTVKPFKAAPVTGRVISSDGAPVVEVTIQANTQMAMGNGAYWFNFQETRTDDRGRFTLPPVRPENPKVELKFTKPGYKISSGGTLTRQGDRFVIADAVLHALDKGRTIKGRVVDAAGKPLAGAIVVAVDSETGPGETRTDATGRFTLPGVPEESSLLAARGSLFGSVSVTRKIGVVVLRLAPVRESSRGAAEDRARGTAILWEIKKRSLATKQPNQRGAYFTTDHPPYSVAPLDLPLALALAKPEGTNPVDDQTLAQMIREVARENPTRTNDWLLPALKEIGISAVRASAAYAVVLGLPEGPAKQTLAKQVYAEMQTLTLTGSEHWVVRRVTQMAVLAGMLKLPDESVAWLDKAILGATTDKEKPYIAVVAHEAVYGGLPLVRHVLAKVGPEQKVGLYWDSLRSLARINARAAQKLLAEMEADTTLPAGEVKSHYARDRALLELVRALAPQDPNAALRIAEQLTGSEYQAAALALSAQGQPDTPKAAGLYERAASQTQARENPEVIAKIAALAQKSDPTLGRKLFARALQMLRDQKASPDIFWQVSAVKTAAEYAATAPGESRLMLAVASPHLLTPQGRKEYDPGDLALAWLPYSVDKALVISATLPEKQENSSGNSGSSSSMRNDILTKIAVWLLTDPAKRSKHLLADYDQYGFDPQDY